VQLFVLSFILCEPAAVHEDVKYGVVGSVAGFAATNIDNTFGTRDTWSISS